MTARLRLASSGLSAGKKARLHRILYKHGLGNGTASRDHDDSLRFVDRLREILAKYPTP